MGFCSEFKEFAVRGNVVDMAVGVVIGGAFGKIVTSFVNDIVMPPLGKLVGDVDFSNLYINLTDKQFANLYINLTDKQFANLAEAKKAGAAVIAYGSFINTIIDFLLVALAVFIVIRQINRLRKPAEEPAPARTCPYCKSEIADDATRCPHCTSQLD